MGCGIVQKQLDDNNVSLTLGVNVLEDVSHNFGGCGVKVKITNIAKGYLVFQHVHEYDHLSVLLSGYVTLSTDDEQQELHGPSSVIIKAGQIHSVLAHTDAVWMCIHKVGEI